MARGKKPKITWGTGFANTLTFGMPLDGAITFSRLAPGSERDDFPSGAAEVTVLGIQSVLEGTARWVPIADQTVPAVATGWDGITGWRAFLEWAASANEFRFYPDASLGTYHTCLLELPDLTELGQGLERGLRWRSIPLRFRTTDGSTFSGY